MKKIISFFVKTYNSIENFYESDKSHKILGSIVVFIFIFSLCLIQLNNWNLLPNTISEYVSLNYFSAVEIAFLVLLAFEVISLVFTLPYSIAKSLHKQFEIISLILLRNAFKLFTNFEAPINWGNNQDTILHIFANSFSAIFIFAGLYIVRKIRIGNIPYNDEINQKNAQSIDIRKMISVLLMVTFFFLAIQDFYLFCAHSSTFKFFTTFYSVLIFSDILLVLISLRYNYSYATLFRNSGFALTTVLLRLALSSADYYTAIITIAAMVFVILLTLIYQISIKQELDSK